MTGRGGSERPRQAGHAVGAAPLLAVEDLAEADDPEGSADGDDPARSDDPAPGHLGPDGPCGPDGADDSGPCDPAGMAAKALELLGDPSVKEVHLTSRAESAATARRLSLSVVRTWGLPHLADTVELLVSELVGNAVRHTGARMFGLRMRRRRGWVRVEVRDPSRALPCLMPVHELDTSGRGLFLVDRLSDRWGVDLQPRGKITWFELRVMDRI